MTRHASYAQGGVLSSGTKGVLDTNVNLGVHQPGLALGPETCTTLPHQTLQLLYRDQPEAVRVELPCCVLGTCRAGNLDMVQSHLLSHSHGLRRVRYRP